MGQSCKTVQFREASRSCAIGEIMDYPVRSTQELGAILTYSKEKVEQGNAAV